jgi:hypothetical protein
MPHLTRHQTLKRAKHAPAKETQRAFDHIRMLPPESHAQTLARVKALMAEPRKARSTR